MSYENQPYNDQNPYSEVQKIPIGQRTPEYTLGEIPGITVPVELSAYGVDDGKHKEFMEKMEGHDLQQYHKNMKRLGYNEGLRVDNQPIPFTTLPLLVGEEFFKEHVTNLKKLSSLFDRVEEAMQQGKLQELRQLMLAGLSKTEQWFLDCALKNTPAGWNKGNSTRFDMFITPDGRLLVVEQNRMAPEGMAFTRGLQIISEEAARKTGFTPALLPHYQEMHYQWLLDKYNTHPRVQEKQRPPRIAISMMRTNPIKESELPLVHDYFNRRAQEEDSKGAIMAYPEQFVVEGDEMFVMQGEKKIPVDIVWINTDNIDHCDPDQIQGYMQILANPHIFPSVNGGLSRIGAAKLTQTALLRLPWVQEAIKMSEEEINLVSAYIPFGIDPILSPNVIVNGKCVLSIDFIKSNKKLFIAKPSLGTHGDGFAAGINFATDDEWVKFVDERVRDGGYIFQERIPYPVSPLPVIDENGKVRVQLVCMDINIQSVGNRPSLIVRASPAERNSDKLTTMNISNGGGAVPTLVI